MNKSAVTLKAVLSDEPRTVSELATRTQLATTTVERAVAELRAAGQAKVIKVTRQWSFGFKRKTAKVRAVVAA